MMKVVPYILYSKSMIDNVRARLHGCLSSWIEKWELPEDFAIVDIASNAEPGSELMDRLAVLLNITGKRDHWILLLPTESALEQLGSMVLHDRRYGAKSAGAGPDGIQGELAEYCLSELAMEILNQSEREGLDVNYLPPPFDRHSIYGELRQGSGAVNFQISSDNDFAIDIYVSPAIVSSGEPVSSDSVHEMPLHSRREALGAETVRAKVMLNDIELTLDALGSISVGDVILLDQFVDEPCMVKFENSELRCRGFLGKKNEKLAVKVDSLVK